MQNFSTFWEGLQPLNHWFFIAAAFFSVFFVWQIMMAFFGLGVDTDMDTDLETGIHHDSVDDATDSVAAFKLLSVRSIIAFFTLFTWAGALYMSKGVSVTPSMGYAVIWGLGAMFMVSLLVYGMRKMTETGNIDINKCIGNTGNVYLDIPANGNGEIRMLCSGIMTHLKARSNNGTAIKTGASVKVTKISGPNSVEVELDHSTNEGKG
ncbi:MAG: hypothetical protein A2283_02620 [Lentisphaerae bacterium RIFOXYA12_FULL_48_11]|nr:MAG: hypothetical protein A2283_02620 [Lentisphaerae bacterium RIFOXYA12_FULL_48_11]